jgi:hypothetical protein
MFQLNVFTYFDSHFWTGYVIGKLQAGRSRNRGSVIGTGKRYFSTQRRDRFWGPHILLIQQVPGAFTYKIKRPKREGGHSSQSSARIKNV